jgi:hypothetical protein
MTTTRIGFMAVAWVSVLATASAQTARAEKIEVNGSGQSFTKGCGGADVDVNGSGHQLTFTGECGKVTVNGTGNVVGVEAPARIKVNGVQNRVTWARGAGGAAKPKISIAGINCKVVKGEVAGAREVVPSAPAAPPAPPPAPPRRVVESAPSGGLLRVGDNRQRITRACDGSDVYIAGNHNVLNLSGDCGRVHVSGNENQLMLDGAAEIGTSGNRNQVSWRRGAGGAAEPRVADSGKNNRVARAN